MSNTSAYTNVVLKTSMAAPVIAKPDYQDGNSPTDFHQTLKNIHETQHSQNHKVSTAANHKPIPKKDTQVEHHNDVKRAKEIKDARATRQTIAERKLVDDSSNTNKKAIDTSSHGKPLGNKPRDMRADKPTEESDLGLAQSGIESEHSQDAPQGVPIGVAVNGAAAQTNEALGSTLNDASLPADVGLLAAAETATAQQGSAASQTSSGLNAVVETQVLGNSLAPETENGANTTPATDFPTAVAQRLEQISQPLLASESLLEEASAQSLAVNSSAAAINQALNNQPLNPATPAQAQVLIAESMTSISSPKSSQPQVAFSDMAELNAEAEDLLLPSATDSALSAKATSAINAPVTGNKLSPDIANSGDEALAPTSTPTSNSSGSTSHSFMDSLMRGGDQQTPAARSFVVQTSVPTPVGQPQWSQAVGEKVLWLAAQNVTAAEINLHPKDLGPMQVRVSVNQEQTTVSFTSHHAVVREVLDQNLNRLRDMFTEQGLNLVNVDVSDKSFSRQQGDSQAQKGQGGSQEVAAEEDAVIAMSTLVQQRLVDHYA